ncbi:30S ribosomal protein S9 [bacterium]|jgi:small subunit ribosomal protein S9|nr:30S ribosomal protein S9 [bacterium]
MEQKTAEQIQLGIGRRKTSTAIVKLKEGKGNISINKKSLDQFFPLQYQQEAAIQSLILLDLRNKFDVEIKVLGGGFTGQADAIKLGIARALVKYDQSLTAQLREHGLLTRNSRMKERKKYGQKGARAKFQWTKR